MLGRVVVENGVKKIVPLTADCGSGNPVGTVIAVYSNKVPNGYLPCNGVAFDTAQFPVLYALLQDDHTPDLRECTLKGIGESGRTVGAHVKAGGLAVGEFIDDQVQQHKHDYVVGETNVSGTPAYYTGSNTVVNFHNAHSTNNDGRSGATTEVKAVGVNWCIKATSGINENQADNVLSALSPVNEVTADNLHSVTSGAVYSALERISLMSTSFSEGSQTLSEPANRFRYILVRIAAGGTVKHIMKPVNVETETVQNTGANGSGLLTTAQQFYFGSQIQFKLTTNYTKIEIASSSWNDPNFKSFITNVWGVSRI